MNDLRNKNIGELVAEDYRTATVFQKYGIDFCCKGNKTIEEVAGKKNISMDNLLADLELATIQQNNEESGYKTWPLDLLADYIEKKHHRYIEERTPVLIAYLDKLCSVHGVHHPELIEITKEFNASAAELAIHMKKEELILFPHVRKMVSMQSADGSNEKPAFGSVQNPIEVMMNEHTVEGDRFRHISEISNNYTPPEEACNTYRVTYSLLQEFENDLHKHIHLENNILFPKAIQMEQSMAIQVVS